jgi:TonB-linked SusC/RagA family outer membrane protein
MSLRLYQKIILVMRLTTVLLIASLMQVSAAGFAQKISLSKSKAPLKSVLKEMRQQSGYIFLYNEDLIKSSKPVSIKVNNAEFEDVLQQIFKDQPLTYSVNENTITIKEKEKSFLENLIARAGEGRYQSIDVRGRVVDDKGDPLVGASVSVKGVKATITDKDGNFYLSNVDEKAVLKLSYIGYKTIEVSATTNLGNVVLTLSDSKLDEVQIQAYGITSQRLSTGNISTIKAKDIAKSPVQNPLLAIAGRMAGVFIQQSSGIPGGGVKVRIQGQNSIFNGNDPLYVIDGIPYSSQLLPSINSILGTSGSQSVYNTVGSPLSFINPGDIESIDILKDADATSIYGSRAANGAILVTTKKGSIGATKIDVNVQNGWGQVTRKAKLLNTQQYLEMRYEAAKNDGVNLDDPSNNTDARKSNRYVDLKFWDQNRYTDWQKELIGGTSQYNDASISISGGNNSTNFLIGTNYKRETTVFPGELGDQKGSIHFNLTHISPNKKLKTSFNGLLLHDHNSLQALDLTNLSISLAPNAPILYNQDGSLNWETFNRTNGTTLSTWSNPLTYELSKYRIVTNNANINTSVSYQIIDGLEVKTDFGYTYLNSNELSMSPISAGLPENRPFITGSASYGMNNINSWTIEPQISYHFLLGRGAISALVGSTLYQLNRNRNALNGGGFTNDLQLEDIKAATTVQVDPNNGSISTKYKYNAIFSRINYNFNNKYIANLTFRRDGSSRFGPENRFHNFGALSAAWIFTEEGFLKTNSILSFGKVKASYGTTGNDQINDYAFISQFAVVSPSRPYQGSNGLTSQSLPNSYLQWEETKKTQIGLDLGFLKDRILLNSTYYVNYSSNQLLAYALPTITGYSNITANFPAVVKNYGWEFMLNTINIKSGLFQWTTSLNLTIPRNKLESFKDLENSTYSNSLILNQPVNIQRLYKFGGVNSTTGAYQFIDKNGGLTSDPGNGTDNQISFYSPDPQFYGGFQNSFTYKKFQLDILFQFVKQIKNNYYFGTNPGVSKQNQPEALLERWQQSGDNKTVQKFSTYLVDPLYVNAFSYATLSDKAYSDASYLRLKNVSFSYQFPDSWKNKLRINNAKLFIQGQNLLTITRYIGLDPENASSVSLPPLRVLTVGFQVVL